jgi:hypothetical protein
MLHRRNYCPTVWLFNDDISEVTQDRMDTVNKKNAVAAYPILR